MRAAFHAAGMHQHMRRLDVAAHGGVRQRTEPAVAAPGARPAPPPARPGPDRAQRRCGRSAGRCARPAALRPAGRSAGPSRRAGARPSAHAGGVRSWAACAARCRTAAPHGTWHAAPPAGAAAPAHSAPPARSASASERCAPASASMSRYRSVPVSTSSNGRAVPVSRQAATDAAERRACSAIIRSSLPACQAARRLTRYADDKNCAQRRAVCQLPLLASASAGVTMTMDGRCTI